MNGYLLSFCLVLIRFSYGEGYLTCSNDESSFNAWLCGLNDWMDSMTEWKRRIEQHCSDEDLGTKWEELFSCSDRITVTCCDETMERCEISDLNCTICYCTDGIYADRKRYQQLWIKHQTDFQTALRLYDEKLRHCGRRSECNEITSTTAKPVSETENTTEVQKPTMNIHPEHGTAQPTELMIGTEDTMTSEDSMSEKSTEPISTTQTKGQETEVTTGEDDETSTVPMIEIPTEASTPTPAVTTPATIMEGSCDIAFNGTCYWTHVQDDWTVNFTRAEEICSNNASIPAYFPNENVYNSVVEDIRSKIPTGWSIVYVWTGVTIDTNTGNVTHPSEDTYVKWYPNFPLTGSPYETRTHVALIVRSDPDSIYQGMYNANPQWIRNGVVCQTTIE